MYWRRLLLAMLVVSALVVATLAQPAPARAAQACFAETGYCVEGRFLAYWQANGGLARNGYPLSGERRETLEDGNEYVVQYFERVRLEYHSENAGTSYDVLLGQFGRRIAQAGTRLGGPADTAPTAPLPGQEHFPATGHNLGGSFLAYWRDNGGLAQFGFPLTEVFEQTLEDGQRYRVQYFERARIELHPENPPPYDILLGQFGRQILAENDLLAVAPGIQRLYVTDGRLQGQLGAVGVAPIAVGQGAYLGFERGAMISRADLRGIYVLCGDLAAGQVRSWGPQGPAYLPDPWQPGDDPGGGHGPRPGLYLPRLGFGELWRENAGLRECLGYATTPDELTYTIRIAEFARGSMLTATTPAGLFVYALHVAGAERRYERFPDPVR